VFKKSFCISSVAVVLAVTPALAQSAPSIVIEHNVAMKTRDGVTLKADDYRPASEGSFPVLLQRTPYNKDSSVVFAEKAVARGFMVVIQDVRGRYTSDGEWYTFKHEIDDGYDTVEWAAALPHSNGKVGLFGGSYVGATVMLAAISHPPHLAGICPVVTASNYHENWTYQGGAFEQWFDESWTAALAQDTANRAIKKQTNALIGDQQLPLNEFPVFNIQPVSSGAELTQELAPYFLAAWYDLFQGGSLRNYLGLKAHAGNQAARDGQHLIIPIGGHSGWGQKVGDVDFGPAAPFDEVGTTLDWFEYLFMGRQNHFASGNPVRIFVMGKNEWRDEPAWPLARATETHYYLDSGGKANSASGDGSLSTSMPGKEGADTFVYDPAHPVPTVGGPLCCDTEHLAPGPRDQKDVEARSDVLVFTTPPLDHDVEVTGPVTLDLFAKSSAVDTDFTGKLVDVWPNGFAQNLTEGILRASFRASTSGEPSPINPGKVYEYKIDLWSTSNVFLKGHRIRLEVSSSNFPRFDRNLNTGKSGAQNSNFITATNTILHGGAQSSALLLPVVP
jgi:uncharacterized protein